MKNYNKNSFFTVLKDWFSSIRDCLFVFVFFVIFLKLKVSIGILLTSLYLLVAIIYSLFKWKCNTFYIIENILYYNKGVFFKSQMKIPCENIATIDTEQTCFQKIFKIETLKIDTNNSGEEEELKLILDDKSAIKFKSSIASLNCLSNNINNFDKSLNSDNQNSKSFNTNNNVIYFMNKNTLFKFSFLKGSKILIITILLYLIRQIYNKNVLSDNNIKFIENILKKSSISYVIILLAPIFFLITLKLISVVYYFIKFYDFKVIKSENNLNINFGSFTKKSYNINLNNIHSVKINQNLGQQLFKTATISVSSFGYGDESKEEAILIPHISEDCIYDLLNTHLKNFVYNGQIFRISKRCKFRYKYARIGYNENILYLSGGILRKKINIITINCIDNITSKQFFFNRKYDLLKISVNYKAMNPSDLKSIKGLSKKHFKELERILFLNE